MSILIVLLILLVLFGGTVGFRGGSSGRDFGDDDAALQGASGALIRESGCANCISKTHALASAFNKYICSSVVCLLQNRCPNTISRLIIPIHVFTFKSHSRRAVPHICEKSAKVVPPQIAHENSPAAVQMINPIRRTETPTLSVKPSAIFLCSLAAQSCAMRALSVARKFLAKASATFNEAQPKIPRICNMMFSAFADTLPSASGSARWFNQTFRRLNCSQHAEFLSA